MGSAVSRLRKELVKLAAMIPIGTHYYAQSSEPFARHGPTVLNLISTMSIVDATCGVKRLLVSLIGA